MDANAARIALEIIRSSLGMPSTASASDIVAKVREVKAAADTKAKRRTFKPCHPMDLGPLKG
jgi:hypothetical protein